MTDIKQGQMVSIKRGAKLSGQAAEVISVNSDEAALKLADGSFTVQKITNIKVPDEPVLTLSELVDVVQNEINGAPNTETLLRLVDALEDRLPGFRSRITV
jgi:hypothetical protein